MALSKDELIRKAHYFRRNPTNAESTALKALRDTYEGAWSFQKNCGFFIFDFFFPERLLVVEIDGSVHEKQKIYDARRDAFANQCGLKVLRIPNQKAQEITSLVRAYPLVYGFQPLVKRAWQIADARFKEYHNSVSIRTGQGKSGVKSLTKVQLHKIENSRYKHF